MTSYRIELGIDEARERTLVDLLRTHNREHAPRWSENWEARPDPSPIHIFVTDVTDKTVGGLVGRTNGIPCWLEISMIWVDPERRRKGMGRELLRLAEAEAWTRGCRYARLATGAHQAPEFYASCGYRLYGRLENCPPGETVFYFCKGLTA